MSTKTPPISQLPSDCGNYVEGEIAEVTNPSPSSTEQKIMIAGSFDSDKIQMIRELMEEEAKAIIKHLRVDGLYYEKSIEETYNIYQQSK